MVSVSLAGQRIPLSRLRKIIGQRMQQSVQTAPHFTLTVEVDMTEAEEWDAWESAGQRAIADILRKEAEALIKGTKPAPQQ